VPNAGRWCNAAGEKIAGINAAEAQSREGSTGRDGVSWWFGAGLLVGWHNSLKRTGARGIEGCQAAMRAVEIIFKSQLGRKGG